MMDKHRYRLDSARGVDVTFWGRLQARLQQAEDAASRLDGMLGREPHLSLVWRATLPSPSERALIGRHGAEVNAVAYLPDLNLVASASDDKSLRIWYTVGASPELARCEEHTKGIWALAVFRSWIATGCDDNTARIFRVKSDGKLELQRIVESQSYVNSVAFTADGKCLVTGNDKGWVETWSTGQGTRAARDSTPRANVRPHGDSWLLSLVTRGALVYSGARSGTVWESRCNSATGELVQVRQLPDSRSWQRGLAATQDGDVITSIGFDGKLRIWRRGEGPRVVDAHAGPARAIAIIEPPGRVALVLTGGDDEMIRAFDLEGNLRFSLAGHIDKVRALAVDPTGDTVFSASADGTIRRWSVSASSLEPAPVCALSSEAECIAIAAPRGTHWDLLVTTCTATTLSFERSLPALPSAPRALAVKVDGSGRPAVAAVLAEGRVVVASPADTTPREVVVDARLADASGIAWRPDGDLVLVTGSRVLLVERPLSMAPVVRERACRPSGWGDHRLSALSEDGMTGIWCDTEGSHVVRIGPDVEVSPGIDHVDLSDAHVVALSAEGRRIVVGAGRRVTVLQWFGDGTWSPEVWVAEVGSPVAGLSVDHRGERVLVTDRDGRVYFYRTRRPDP